MQQKIQFGEDSFNGPARHKGKLRCLKFKVKYLRVSGGGSVLRGSSKHRGIVVVVLDTNVDRSRPDLSIPAITLIPVFGGWHACECVFVGRHI